MARFEHDKRVIAARAAKMAKELSAQADKLSQVSVTITASVGEGDRLYGSVTTRDIAEALKAQGVVIDSKKLQLRRADQGAGHDRGADQARPQRGAHDQGPRRQKRVALRQRGSMGDFAAGAAGSGRTPPQNLDAERSALGGVLVKPSAIDDLITSLVADDFFVPAHREVFEAMLAIDRRRAADRHHLPGRRAQGARARCPASRGARATWWRWPTRSPPPRTSSTTSAW